MTAVDLSGRSDAELVRDALRGSEQAFRDLVLRYERPAFNLIVRLVGDRALAQDLTQETFIKAFTRLETYDPTRKFAAWFLAIAHNATLDHLRRRRPETIPFDEGDTTHGAAPEQLAALPADERLALEEALDAAFTRIRAEYREVLVLRYQEGFTYDEIAEITGQPIGTVKTFLHRGRKELAADLRRQGWRP